MMFLFCGATYDSEVVEGAGVLNVLQGLLQILKLHVDTALGLLGILDGLSLEGLDSLDLARDIVGDWLEGLEVRLYRIDNSLVLEDGAVVSEVDRGWLLLESRKLAAGILVALLEGVEGGDSRSTESEVRGDCCPVKLESCATLRDVSRRLVLVASLRAGGRAGAPARVGNKFGVFSKIREEA